MIQSLPVKNIRKVGKKEQNEANCTTPFTCNCKITTDKLFQTPYLNLISTHDFNFHPLCVRLMPFTKERASLHEKPAKHKLHLSAQSSLTSETRHFYALTHNLYFCAYSGLQNTLKIHSINLCIWFRSCEDRRLNQSRSTAVIPG